MKARFLIVGGICLLLLGLVIIAYEVYGNTSFQLDVETELVIIFGMVALGLIISGVGVVLEFSAKKWSPPK